MPVNVYTPVINALILVFRLAFGPQTEVCEKWKGGVVENHLK